MGTAPLPQLFVRLDDKWPDLPRAMLFWFSAAFLAETGPLQALYERLGVAS